MFLIILLRLYHLNDPLSHQPLIGLLQVHRELDDGARFEDELEGYISEFGRDEAAMHELSAMAGRWTDHALVERIYELCREHGLDTEAPAYHWIEALVGSERYARALDVVENWDEVPGEWERGYALPLKAQLTVAQFGVGNRAEGQILIGELFGEGFLRPDHYTTMAERLMGQGEHGQARRVLAHVRNNYPLFKQAVSKLIELDMETRNRNEILTNVQRYLSMRQPSIDLLRRAYSFIGSDLFIYDSEREEVLHTLEDALGET